MLIAAWLAGPYMNQQTQKPTIAYELYSWQHDHGEWVFSLLPALSGRNRTAKEVFNRTVRLRGIDKVNTRISKLPEGTTIFMGFTKLSDTPPGAKGNSRLALPPASIIEAITRHAEKHKIKVEVLSRATGNHPLP